MPGQINARCEGCGRPILWAKTEGGETIPLDTSAPTYKALPAEGGLLARRDQGTFVSHFVTCSKREAFTKTKRPTEIEDGVAIVNVSAADLLKGLCDAAVEALGEHLPPDGASAADTINKLLGIFDGPLQRVAFRRYEQEKKE